MVVDILLGVIFGAAALWAVYVGLYDELTLTRGQRARSLPRSFWRRSLMVAIVGAVIGGVLMWRIRVGA